MSSSISNQISLNKDFVHIAWDKHFKNDFILYLNYCEGVWHSGHAPEFLSVSPGALCSLTMTISVHFIMSSAGVIPSVKFSHKYKWYPCEHGGPEPSVTSAGGTQKVGRYKYWVLQNEETF